MRHGSALAAWGAAAGLLAACAHRQAVDSSPPAVAPGVFSLRGTWVKEKGRKFDVGLTLRNESPAFQIVFLSDLVGGRGAAEDRMRHATWGWGERTIDLRPGEEKSFTMSCSVSADAASAPVHVTVRRVYENPSRDGRTPGKVVAEGVTWTAP